MTKRPDGYKSLEFTDANFEGDVFHFDVPVPAHSSFSKNRHGRFRDSEALRFIFETVLRRCMSAGLVGGEGFAVDASVMKADANRDHALAGESDIDWEKDGRAARAVRGGPTAPKSASSVFIS